MGDYGAFTARVPATLGGYLRYMRSRQGKADPRDTNLRDELPVTEARMEAYQLDLENSESDKAAAEENARIEREMRGGKDFFDETRRDISPEARKQARKIRRRRSKAKTSKPRTLGALARDDDDEDDY